jgi:hypothetical protein
MDKKTLGMLLGVVGVILWFMPLAYVNMGGLSKIFGTAMYQTGHHIGGIAYLLVISSGVYTVSSWFLNKQISIVAAGVSFSISALFLVQVGSSAAWGLISLVTVSVASLMLAFKMEKPVSSS